MAEFHGMNDQAGQAAVETFESARTTIQSAADDLKSAFAGVQWQGPDAEDYTPRFQQLVDGRVGDLLGTLQAKGNEFRADVEEQTATSGS
jgi:hypothetical protein